MESSVITLTDDWRNIIHQFHIPNNIEEIQKKTRDLTFFAAVFIFSCTASGEISINTELLNEISCSIPIFTAVSVAVKLQNTEKCVLQGFMQERKGIIGIHD